MKIEFDTQDDGFVVLTLREYNRLKTMAYEAHEMWGEKIRDILTKDDDCFTCEYSTPNGECRIGTIENCAKESKKKMNDFLFEIMGEDSDLCGEEFFVECYTEAEAWRIAEANFPNEELYCWGRYSPAEAEMMGYDTY